MKPVNQIIQTKEYKQHVFSAALKEFACEWDVALYYDSSRDAAIIYHLRNSKKLNEFFEWYADELPLTHIPTFIKDNEDDLSKNIQGALQEIYDKFMNIAVKYEYKDGEYKDEMFKAYDIKSYSEMWENKEFKEIFKKDVAETAKQLQPIQDLVNVL